MGADELATGAVAEGQHFERKSLRKVVGRTADFAELAQDCVCFANGAGGQIIVGVEDDAAEPPAAQRIEPELLDRVRKRIGELTVNVQALAEIRRADNGGEYLALNVPRSVGVASTSDGRYFLRIGDSCCPVVGDDVLRLADDRPATPWEAMTSLRLPRAGIERARRSRFVSAIRASDRVNTSVKEKSDDELLDHYGLASGNVLTNLGVLLVGGAAERAKLGTAPVIQAIKYDERGEKIAKQVWDDYSLSPIDLIDAVWRAAPAVTEGTDSVHVVVPRRVIHPGVIRLIADADRRFQLTQRERIALGTLAQSEGLSAAELAQALELPDPIALRPWMGRLLELGLVRQAGRTRATRYFVAPALLRDAGLDAQTTLRRIEPHRLRALIAEDVGRYPGSAASEIHKRVGVEIPERTFRRALQELVARGVVRAEGERRWRRYHPGQPIGQNADDGR